VGSCSVRMQPSRLNTSPRSLDLRKVAMEDSPLHYEEGTQRIHCFRSVVLDDLRRKCDGPETDVQPAGDE